MLVTGVNITATEYMHTTNFSSPTCKNYLQI